MDTVDTKTCRTCGQTKPRTDYYKNSAAPDGLFASCKPCVKAKQKTYTYDLEKKRERNRRNMRDRDKRGPVEKAYRQRNHEKVLEWKRGYRERNPTAWNDWYQPVREERLAAQRAVYDPDKKRAERTPGQSRRDRERRRARLLDAFVEDVYFDDILTRDLGHCGICDQPIMELTIELDHIIPLAAGGMHEQTNVQLAHRACNRRKGTQTNFSLRDAA